MNHETLPAQVQVDVNDSQNCDCDHHETCAVCVPSLYQPKAVMVQLTADGVNRIGDTVAELRLENEQLRFELSSLRDRLFTNGDRVIKMEGRVFTVEGDGFILDNNFDFDAGLQVSGDFVDGEKNQYAQMIVAALNGHNAALTGAAPVQEETK